MSHNESAPLVLISTANDEVPVIIEWPEHYPFYEGERELWREASEDEYDRYYQHYMRQED
jgi:hypothetical protein